MQALKKREPSAKIKEGRSDTKRSPGAHKEARTIRGTFIILWGDSCKKTPDRSAKSSKNQKKGVLCKATSERPMDISSTSLLWIQEVWPGRCNSHFDSACLKEEGPFIERVGEKEQPLVRRGRVEFFVSMWRGKSAASTGFMPGGRRSYRAMGRENPPYWCGARQKKILNRAKKRRY